MTEHVHSAAPTVGQLVAQRPARARVFERLGIDYCCGGRKTLAAVCAQRGLEVSLVQSQLDAIDAEPHEGGEPDWTTAPLSTLADHIQSVHHGFLNRELPRLGALVRKVATVHGDVHPDLRRLNDVFADFSQELRAHMAKEESVLFPRIRALESGSPQDPSSSCPLEAPVRRMMQEHDDAGIALAAMRDLTHGYVPPEDACGSYRVMLSGLQELETDMHTHVHKENNILFPRALALDSLGLGGVNACCTRRS
ncbi:MAG: iron-sulfur cluster repair di-iron protein [Phycisphaerales bacterium]|nr:iron-sulfur cluster repair di-iron protein [Phycisphaerales bacterium]